MGRLEDHERGGELDDRVALLLARRRAGLLTDEKLRLAAYLGDPAARVLWAPQRPAEDELRRALHPRYFAGVAEEVENRWRHLLAESRVGAGREARLMAALIEAAAREPRLRRLVPISGPTNLGFQRSTEAPCFFSLAILVGPGRAQPSYNLINLAGGLGRAEVRQSEDVEDIVAATVSLLPASDVAVYRGAAMAYPAERARRGVYVDERDLEGWLCGLITLGVEVLLRGVVSVRLQELSAAGEDGGPEGGIFVSLARAVVDPSSVEQRRAVAMARQLHPSSLASLLPALWGKRAPASARRGLLVELGQEARVQERLRGALVPWALGDGDPLRPWLEPDHEQAT